MKLNSIDGLLLNEGQINPETIELDGESDQFSKSEKNSAGNTSSNPAENSKNKPQKLN